MTIQDQFYNWQSNPRGYDWSEWPFEECLPAPRAMRSYCEERWGLHYLGCEGDRDIIGGSSPSTHAFGGAFDARYQDPGPGLLVVDSEIIPWLIVTSKETGLQAIHHYKKSLIWRPPGTSGRPVESDGWRLQPKGTQMGQSWAVWLHLEFHPDGMDDGRTIEEKLGELPPIVAPPIPPPPPPVIINPPVTPPVLVPGATTIVDVAVETIRRGSVGPKVSKCQALLLHNFGQAITVDGNFGAQTSEAVINVQRFFGLTADGIVGPKSWKVLLELP